MYCTLQKVWWYNARRYPPPLLNSHTSAHLLLSSLFPSVCPPPPTLFSLYPPLDRYQLPIPLFLKASLGPNARGLKFGGNAKLVDSREHFATTVAGILSQENSPEVLRCRWRSPSLECCSHPAEGGEQANEPTPVISGNERSAKAAENSCLDCAERDVAQPEDGRLEESNTSATLTSAVEGMDVENPRSENPAGDGSKDPELGVQRAASATEETKRFRSRCSSMDTGRRWSSSCPQRPWETSEEVGYFIAKIVAGSFSAVVDYVLAVR